MDLGGDCARIGWRPTAAPAAAQVKFDHPVCITSFRVCGGEVAGAPQMLRLFARDLYALPAGRFAPLVMAPLSVGVEASTHRTEVGH